MMNRKQLPLILLAVAGVAYAACETLPIPLGEANPGWWDYAVKVVNGYGNPANAAVRDEIDQMGRATYGDDRWKGARVAGYVTYTTPMGGRYSAPFEKDCDEEMLDNADKNGDANASGGGGSYNWYGGRIYDSGGCLYGCSGTVTVGEVDPV